jgi:hypothetical protein
LGINISAHEFWWNKIPSVVLVEKKNPSVCIVVFFQIGAKKFVVEKE